MVGEWFFVVSAIAVGGGIAMILGVIAFVATVEQLNASRRKELHERGVQAAKEAGGIS